MTSPQWTDRSRSAKLFVDAVTEDPDGALMVFDFDGTLSRIVPNPDDARMVEESSEALGRLADSGVQIAIISGRPVDTLLRLSQLDHQPSFSKVIVFGHYGAERLNIATGERTAPRIPPGIEQARNELVQLLGQYSGSTLEDKEVSVVAHFRNCPDADGAAEDAEPAIRDLANRNHLAVTSGKYVWELRGETTTKGDALRELVQESRPSALLFAGDDVGDIPAFRMLRELGDPSYSPVTCAVVAASSEAPDLDGYADVLCDGPEGLAAWLIELAGQVAGG